MQSIIFDDGYRTYDINGDESRVIRVNVSDFNLLRRNEEAEERISELVRQLSAANDPTPEDLAEYDKGFREQINYIFGTDVCTPAFGESHCMSIVSDGRMLYEEFLEALLKQVEQDIAERRQGLEQRRRAASPKVQQYIDAAVPHIDISALSEEQKSALRAQLE